MAEAKDAVLLAGKTSSRLGWPEPSARPTLIVLPLIANPTPAVKVYKVSGAKKPRLLEVSSPNEPSAGIIGVGLVGLVSLWSISSAANCEPATPATSGNTEPLLVTTRNVRAERWRSAVGEQFPARWVAVPRRAV